VNAGVTKSTSTRDADGKSATSLWRRAFVGLIKFYVALAFLLFLPAWTVHFWEGWLYWIVMSACSLLITLFFLKYDPSLVERRLVVGPGAEQTPRQKLIQAVASLLVLACFILPGLDHHFHWSSVSTAVVIIANALVVVSFLIFFVVFRENSFAAGTVRVEAEQRVISSGPYAIVRHPMYVGAILLFLATPFALGSWVTLVVAVPLCLMVVVRLLDEERYLSNNLAGYEDYRRRVRYRLLPFVW
jgi:protein-S-isoprenylcysteine O-methyltransferase Ste14